MDEREMALRNCLLEYPVGSKLYGTDTAESDEDFCGVFIADKEYYIGMKKVEEVDFSVIDKLENGRNSKDAIDRKFYELKKFFKLAMDNNPNIIEQLFVKPEICVQRTELGDCILRNAHLFPYVGCYDKFIGYAVSQKKKMIVKRDNMEAIVEGIKILKGFDPKQYVAERLSDLLFFDCTKEKNQHVQFGDCHVQKNDTFKQALRKLEERRGKFSGRHGDFVSKYGYDTKFASHLIRLLIEGGQLLRHGFLEFPLPQAEIILSIKQGNLTVKEVLEYAEELEDQMRGLKLTTKLPKKPRLKEIQKLQMDIVTESFRSNQL